MRSYWHLRVGSKARGRGGLVLPMLLVACLAMFWIAGAQGVPGNQSVFELDASLDLSNGLAPRAAVTDNATAGLPDDWDRVCHTFTITEDVDNTVPDQCASAANDHATARSFDSETAADGTADQSTIFTGGGSKDQQPLSNWAWKDNEGGLPDKDNLLHAMAARYSSGGNSYIFFGADRFDNSGDAQIGFWFFRSPVCTKADGSFGSGTATNCSGTAAHVAGTVPHSASTPGDILILSDFTNGGTQPTIRIYRVRWLRRAAKATLNLLGGNVDDVRDCALVSTDDFCASVNNLDGAVSPWLFKNKSGETTFGHGEFYEGGLNLNTLGLQSECFSSFAAETRSSQSVTATLKDFVLGSFEACASALTTRPGNGAAGTDNVQLTDSNANTIVDTSIGTGSVQVRDRATLNVTGIANWSGNLKFWLCGPIAPSTPPGRCTTGGTQIGAAAGVAVNQGTAQPILSDAATVTSAGRYCWRGEFNSATPGVPNSTDASLTECFEVLPVTPTITTNATTVVAGLGSISDTATLSGTATQPGSPIIQGPVGSPAGGSIVFRAYGPNDATCTGTAAFTSSDVSVSGDGTYGPVSFTPTALGTYRWIASYSGNSPNTNATSGACGDANETTNVVDANVSITPQEATNEVGSGHVFTITTEGFPAGTTATLVSITPTLSPAHATTSTCDSPTTPAGEPNKRTCTVTLNSSSAGQFELNASAVWSFTGLATNVTRSTSGNSGPNGSDSAIKHFVDANVSITPQEATNEVGSGHVFTITTEAFPAGTTATLVSITPTLSPAHATTSTCDSPTTPAGEPNKRTCTVTLNSSSAGQFELNASAVWSFTGLATNVTRSTSGNSGPNGSDSAIKHFVDANVSITPQEATNEVGSGHVFTITTEAFPAGTTATLVSITPTLSPAHATTSTCDSPTTPAGEPNKRTCTVTLNSSSAGQFELNASAVWSFTGLATNVTRSTSGNSGPNGSDSAIKHFVDANVSITPQEATNEVGSAHVFTITTEAFPAGTTATLVSITPSISPTPSSYATTCGDSTLWGGSGDTRTCTVTINSTTTGTFTLDATAVWSFSGLTGNVTRSTSGTTGPDGSDSAVKSFVDANVSITPQEATNAVGSEHVFTISTTAVPAGTTATLQSITPSISPTPSSYATTCGDSTLWGGSGDTRTCTVTINSTTTGTFTLDATAVWSFSGLTGNVTRSTSGTSGPGGSDSAEKTYVDANIAITPSTAVNPTGTNHVLTITVNALNGTLDAGSHTATATIESGPGSFVGGNTCDYTGGGTTASCTVTITSALTGTTVVSATSDDPGQRPDDHPHDRHGGEHGLRRERQRVEDVGRCADHDQPERDEQGRRPAYVHGLRREAQRHGLDSCSRCGHHDDDRFRFDGGRHVRPDRTDGRER